ncbi:uncharacterized protein KY384_004447 [Bacidia gigantensis]|uniref:uncharacterized protein n=1 Tax=Bacidia gigantensis TaxID=2732470 RepID=UPI001D04A062|nr:uncharacterized protein KY384_004447 [Bacidia gigantensis]KAG8531090.1 hypothetical protein KY384_004447 [Bacidia gigantensis]
MQNALPGPRRYDGRIIIHFDYDCFYAAVFEKENPSLKALPFAVQQKQIIVTCNYEARRRGLYKLQLVHEARKHCPEVIIKLGEDLTRFRDASKENYNFLQGYTWSNKVERLGFDEVFMDMTDIIDYNVELLNFHHLPTSYFHLDRSDPTIGFSYDASSVVGETYPKDCADLLASSQPAPDDSGDLPLRLRLGSHLARYLRHELEQRGGYSATVGISTNKVLSKLIGNVNKPKRQTTLMPPYNSNIHGESNVNAFIDAHDIGKIPNIGFKTAQKLRAHVLGRSPGFDTGLVYGGTTEKVSVKDIRLFNGMGPTLLRRMLQSPGAPRDLPEKAWGLLNGVDDTEVAKGKGVPQQISMEDSYIRLDEMSEVVRELQMLSVSLIKRMRLDLTADNDDPDANDPLEDTNNVQTAARFERMSKRKWIALPSSLRLSTRPRPPLNPDGTRTRTFARISKSHPMPSFVFNLAIPVDILARRLVEEIIMPQLFRKLHPEKSGWNLSLVNVCATGMAMRASDGKEGVGRDIKGMFQKQDHLLSEWKVEDVDRPPSQERNEIAETIGHVVGAKQDLSLIPRPQQATELGSEDGLGVSQCSNVIFADDWDNGDEMQDASEVCKSFTAVMPAFAMVAHKRFHDMID